MLLGFDYKRKQFCLKCILEHLQNMKYKVSKKAEMLGVHFNNQLCIIFFLSGSVKNANRLLIV